jgi:hypothetical protein
MISPLAKHFNSKNFEFIFRLQDREVLVGFPECSSARIETLNHQSHQSEAYMTCLPETGIESIHTPGNLLSHRDATQHNNQRHGPNKHSK